MPVHQETKDPFAGLEYRCPVCSKLVLKGMLLKGYIEFKCLRCRSVFGVQGFSQNEHREQYLILSTKEGVITNCSTSTEKFLGRTPEELRKTNVSALYKTAAERTTDQVLASRVPKFPYLRFDTQHVAKPESLHDVTVTLKFLPSRSNPQVARLVRPRPATEVGIKERGTFLSGQYSNFDAEMDLKGNLVYADKKSFELSGYVPEEVIGKYWFDFVPPEEVAWREANMHELFASRASYRVLDSRVIRKDGKVVEYEAFGTPNYDDLGNLVGYKFTNWLKE